MSSPPVLRSAPYTGDGRTNALEQALATQAFSRSEQLSRFLKFICELEVAGRGTEINEYLIAQSVLGRAGDYNPVEDATVRNRAHSLRKKLEEIYNGELAEASVRIELPKGSYRPRFVDAAPVPAIFEMPVVRRVRFWPYAFAGFLGGVTLCAAIWAVYAFAFAPPPVPGKDPIVREIWGPLLAPDANTLVCVGTPLQLFVRPYPVEHPPENPTVLLLDPEQDRQIYSHYLQGDKLRPDHRLFANITQSSPLWGDGIGAVLATQVLSQAGATWELWPERAGSAMAMRNRNLILFARPEYSETARLFDRNLNFYIDYSPKHRNVTIINRKPKPGEQAEYVMDPPQDRRETFGLITVLPSPGIPDQQRRTVVISGLASPGIQAAAEFFTSPRSLRDLRERFRAEGLADIPARYQVVVRTAMAENAVRAWRYETHRVLTR